MASTIFCYPGSHSIVDGKRIEEGSLKDALKSLAPKEPEAPKAEVKKEPEATKAKAG